MSRDRDPRSLTTSGALVRAFAAIASLAAANCIQAQVPGYTITTIAGGGQEVPGNGNGGPATSAFLSSAWGLAVDAAGDLYIADAGLSLVRKVSAAGTITKVAGGGTSNAESPVGDGGQATSAVLSGPTDVSVDVAGNLYIADAGHNRIREVTVAGIISTVAGPGSSNGALGDGGPAASATLDQPEGIAVDAGGNLYIADTGHNRIRKISIDGKIATVAGGGAASMSAPFGDGGQATAATLSAPTGIALDASGNLYISDSGHHRVRVVSPAGIVTTVAGGGAAGYSGDGGLATLAELGPSVQTPLPGFYAYALQCLAVDSMGDLYISDTGNGRLRVITADGKINTIAGDGSSSGVAGDNGPATSAALPYPIGVALGDGKVYVGDSLLQSAYPEGAVRLLTPSATPVFPAPSIEAGGVVTASSWGDFAQLAQGSWIEIYGSYLASDSRTWDGTDFNGTNAPMSLDGTSVTIGGQPAFIYYISPGQLDVQAPTTSGTGAQPLVVSTGSGKSATYMVGVNGLEPGLLAPALNFKIGSVQYAVALFPDGATYVLPSGAIAGVSSRPAQAGDTITLYGVGFGSVTPDTPAGQIAPPSSKLDFPLIFKIGGTEATVTYAGLAPGEVGVYQFNLVVPKLNSTGAVRLTFTLDGVAGGQTLYLSTQ